MEHVTPHSLEAERAVLGAPLVHSELFLEVADRLSPDHFFRDAHAKIYVAMRQVVESGQPIDMLTLTTRLKQAGLLEDVGGHAYVSSLADGMPRSANIGHYADIVIEHATRARVIGAARQILADAQGPDCDARELLDRAERAIFAIGEQAVRGDFVDAASLLLDGVPAIERLLETKHGTTGLQTGYRDFDQVTRGLHAGSLVLLAARPSMGKSALALNVAYHAASRGQVVGFFSLEMSKQELFMRLVSSVGRIDGHRLQSGYVSQSDYGRMSEAFSEIGQSGLFVDDSSNLGVLELRGKARRLKAKHGLALIVVDYLQLMQLGKSENRNLAVADVSRALKLLARELEVPVMALSQLSRETEKRSDKRPMLSDLRDSGALEQDADLVCFIHRPEVYGESSDNKGLAEVVIAKQRNGPIGTVRLHWSGETMRFDDWSDR